jgi:hypothetical protein
VVVVVVLVEGTDELHFGSVYVRNSPQVFFLKIHLIAVKPIIERSVKSAFH